MRDKLKSLELREHENGWALTEDAGHLEMTGMDWDRTRAMLLRFITEVDMRDAKLFLKSHKESQ